MRLWSLHPRLLDSKGLVAVWRESLLAQAVIMGKTTGYRFHPQLKRFKETKSPEKSISSYLRSIHQDATDRGYNFNIELICFDESVNQIEVTSDQLQFEWNHLSNKLEIRDPGWCNMIQSHSNTIDPHPLFHVVSGPIAEWERR